MSSSLPFLMDESDSLSQWRAETFWTKEVETLAWLEFFSEFEDASITNLVDVGSNVGVYSLYWLSMNPSSQVVACEPFEKNMKLLKSNLRLNSMLDRVELISSPLYSTSVSGSLVLNDLRPGSSGSQFRTIHGVESGLGHSVDSTTLDNILFGNIDRKILKIDVDGLDFEILQGAKASLLSGSICSVLIEAPEPIQFQISAFLEQYMYVPDLRFDAVESHSDLRRIAAGKSERNRVYTQSACF